MSMFDGSPDELTYGQALVELAGRVSWPTEAHGLEVVAAIEKEHGIGADRAQPEPVAFDPRDADLADKAAELDRLRAELAARDKADSDTTTDGEIERLKAELAARDSATVPTKTAVPTKGRAK